MINGVIFDMDGLMIDSEVISEKCFVEALKERGYVYPDNFFIDLLGRSDLDAIKTVAERIGNQKDAEIIQARSKELMHQHYLSHGVPAKKGLYELFNYLIDNKIKIAVASSNFRGQIEYNLKNLNLYDKVDFISPGNEVENSKPHPEIFLKACSGIGVDKKNAIILEDSENGVKAANNAGINVIIIPDIINHPQEINEMAVAVLGNLTEVIDFIKKRNRGE